MVLCNAHGFRPPVSCEGKIEMGEIVFLRCGGNNKDFIENCRLLDADLDLRVGKIIKRDKYAQYNLTDKINEAIVVYRDNHPIGGGAIRPYDENTVELKRVFIIPAEQGKGIGKELVSKLIEWAKELGYRKMILETEQAIEMGVDAASGCIVNILLLDIDSYEEKYGKKP